MSTNENPSLSKANDPIVLPPSVSLKVFHDFCERARGICGEFNVNVISRQNDIAKTSYLDQSKAHDMFNVLEKDYFVASAVVCPREVTEVQEIMKLCNELLVPVWPISIGRNVGYGGAAPRVRGSVSLDLGKNMNRVLQVSEEGAYALLEPGVTFFDLHKYLLNHNSKLMVDVPDLGGGSIIGNTVERGVGYTPYGDHFSMHCGMEVVLPSGELLRTGMGALPNPSGSAVQTDSPDKQIGNKSWQLFNYGFGPYNDGIFSQSNLGIVVKMGVWLMPKPHGYQSFMITFPEEDDLHQIVETVRNLRIQQILQNVPTIRHILLDAAVRGSKSSWTSTKGPIGDDEINHIAQRLNLGRWNLYGALYGAEIIIKALWKIIESEFGKIKGAKFYFPENTEEGSVLQIRDKTLKGIPTVDELEWVNWLPNGAHAFVAPISPVTGYDAMQQFKITKEHMVAAGFDFMATFTIGMREMHHIVCLVFDREDKDSRKRAFELITNLIRVYAEHGWGEYRTPLAFMDQVAETYSFNDNAQMRLNEVIKNALDPNGILAPGKNGVWPATYEKEEWRIL